MSGNVKEAYEDFENSVKYNHLNYVGYYNLHTFYAFSGNNFQALQSLCCAISCLYLMRGQKNCNQHDINKAIKHSENNLEARLAKCLMFLKKGKTQMALNEIKWVLEIQPSNHRYLLIKNKIQQNLQKDQPLENQEGEKSEPNCQPEEQQSKRLKCTFYEEEQLSRLNLEEALK